MISDERINQLVSTLRERGKDDESCEAKSCAGRLGESVWESVSAFANTEGGTLLLGLSEREGFKPVKGFPIQKIGSQFIDGMGDGSPTAQKVRPAPRYEVHEVEVDNSPVLAIRIHELSRSAKPCYVESQGVQGGSYKRVGDCDVRLTAAEIYELSNVDRPSSADRSPVPDAAIEDLDSTDIHRLIANIMDSGSRAFAGCQTDEERLTRLHVLTKQGEVTLGGLLCMGFYPQQFLPAIVIDVAAHPGMTKGSDPDTLFFDRRICDGSMPEAIDDAIHAIMRNLKTRSTIRGTERVETTELPKEVLREALVNAVVHREYGALFLGQPINVDIYPDRVEVRNPGGLWGGVSKETLGDGLSRCRNQELMRLLREFTNPESKGPFVEGNGTGIQAMRVRMRREGLPEPDFEPTIDQFTVTFRRPSPSKPTSENQPRRLTRTQEDVLRAIEASGGASIQELSDRFGKSAKTLRPHLRALMDMGVIEATASSTSKNRRYRRKAAVI